MDPTSPQFTMDPTSPQLPPFAMDPTSPQLPPFAMDPTSPQLPPFAMDPTSPPLLDYFTNEPVHGLQFENAIVVGSSGNLLKTRLSDVIDSHQAVIRMNAAPVNRYKQHVGTKTTIRLVAHNALKTNMIPLLGSCKYLIIWGTSQHYHRIRKIVAKIRKRYPVLPIYKFSQAAMSWNDTEYQKRTSQNRFASGAWLSTGWFAIFLALNIAQKVTACGFGCAKKCIANTPYHYWERNKNSEVNYIMGQQNARKGHRFITEMDVFVKWCVQYPLNFI